MCGIVGIFHFSTSSPGSPALAEREQAHLLRMRDALRHRGPDDAGAFASPDRRVLLGHRRLSIVDLSPAGRQPMSNEDGSVWITFNGEIYNHLDLRPGLLARGHRFRSHADTEAIVHLYEDLGPACLDHLDGMFALGLWDAGRGHLLLARDRAGKKPLYYTVAGGALLFASEIRALLQHPAVSRDLDMEALNLYLTFADVPPPHTLFAGVRKLPAAHQLLCDRNGQIAVRRYWSPLDPDGRGLPWPAEVPEAEAVERVRDLLQTSVRKRLMSDVPVGAFLSGGVDSSANVALMSRLHKEPLRTFSIGFAGFGEAENFHDLPYARRVADLYGCRHTEVTITAAECQSYLKEMAGQQDEPIGDPACLPMHFVSKTARQAGIIVVLVGEGSDEVFGGYPNFAEILQRTGRRWRSLLRVPRLLRRGLYRLSHRLPTPAGRRDLLRRAASGEPLYWGLDVVFWEEEKRGLLLPAAWPLPGAGPAAVLRRYYAELLARQPRADLMQQMSYIELQNRLPELLLMRVDKFSMAHSLEARAPFLDHALISYALSLPQDLKVRGPVGKHVLKEAVRPMLPAEVIDRPKQGFRVPLPEWLAGPLSSWAERLLFHSSLRGLDLFNFDHIGTMWQRHRARVADHSFDLWCLINLAAWHEHWLGGAA